MVSRMSTIPPTEGAPGIDAVRAEFPDWTISPGSDVLGWLADRQLSGTATRTVAGVSAADLLRRLRKATRSDG